MVVVVVITAFVGVGGGGADTMCELGSVVQPMSRTNALQQARAGTSGQSGRIDGGGVARGGMVIFIPASYTFRSPGVMGCCRYS